MSERWLSTRNGQTSVSRPTYPPIVPIRQPVLPSRGGTYFSPSYIPDAKNLSILNPALRVVSISGGNKAQNNPHATM